MTTQRTPDLNRIRTISNQLASFTEADLVAVKDEIWRLEILRDLIAATLGTLATTQPVLVPVGNAHAPAADQDAGAKREWPERSANSTTGGKWATRIARLIYDRGSLTTSQIAAHFQTKRQNFTAAITDHPWFSKSPGTGTPWMLTDAGRLAMGSQNPATEPPPEPVVAPASQPSPAVDRGTEQAREMIRRHCLEIATAIVELERPLTVEEISQELKLDLTTVQRRLNHNGPQATTPATQYFTQSQLYPRLWTVTAAGRALVEQADGSADTAASAS